MKILLTLLLLIPSLSWGKIPEECKDIRNGEEAYNFSSKIIHVFEKRDLLKLSEMTHTLYGNGNINYYDLTNLNMVDIFDENMIDDLVSRAKPICERFSFEGYNFGWGIWFEFLGIYDDKCSMKMTPKIVALNEGVKKEFQISDEEITVNSENVNSSQCD